MKVLICLRVMEKRGIYKKETCRYIQDIHATQNLASSALTYVFPLLEQRKMREKLVFLFRCQKVRVDKEMCREISSKF